MSTLLIGTGGGSRIDLACIGSGEFVLWRRGDDVRLTLDERNVTDVRQALALHGVHATPADGGVPEAPRLLAAIGIGLSPARLTETDEIDLLEVRVVPLAEATARLTRRRFRLLPLSGRRRARCRALLRGTDALLEVRRSAWCHRSTLAAARHCLRPVLFDRSATPHALGTYAADGQLARWIIG